MKKNRLIFFSAAFCILLLLPFSSFSQIGRRFPSERKVVKDPVTGTMLTFLTSTPNGDSKAYPTHPQWTSDGKWVVFRSGRVKGEAMAVNEETGTIVQVTEGGYSGMLCLAQKSMKLYFMRNSVKAPAGTKNVDIIEVDLAKLFADSEAGKLKKAEVYQRNCGSPDPKFSAGGDMALDGDEEWAYFRIQNREEAAKYLAPGTKIAANFGPRNMGAGPTGVGRYNVKTGETRHVVSVPFQVGHIQGNPWQPGEVVFCWETGGKAPQRTWYAKADGSGLRPLYPEASYEWVTHEAVTGKDEVTIAILGHRRISNAADTLKPLDWGNSGTKEKPTGLAIVNLRTREVEMVGQAPSDSFWHVHASPDGRWATGDDFSRSLHLIDRHTSERLLLTTGHKQTAADHVHPTFSPDGKKIQIQSAMLSADNRSMNICIVPVPEAWLKRIP